MHRLGADGRLAVESGELTVRIVIAHQPLDLLDRGKRAGHRLMQLSAWNIRRGGDLDQGTEQWTRASDGTTAGGGRFSV